MSGIVTPVSARLVETTILRTPGGGRLNTAAWSSFDTDECSGSTLNSREPKSGWPSSVSTRRRMLSSEGMKTSVAAEKRRRSSRFTHRSSRRRTIRSKLIAIWSMLSSVVRVALE